MEILQHIWDATPEGEVVVIYTMRNALGSEVQLSNLGAGVVSVKFADRNGVVDDVVLGYRSAKHYMGDPACCGKSIGRVAGRIANGRMTIDGEEYSLEINYGMNHMHGASKNFANRLWESSVEGNRIVFTILSEEGEGGYPHDVAAQVVYDFDDENNFEITYLAKSSGTTPVNLTSHIYWNLAGEASGSILDHTLQLNASQVLEVNDRQIPTGRLLDVTGSVMDFREARRLGDGIDDEFNRMREYRGYDHYLVVDGWRKNILGEVGTLSDPKSGRRVEILSSQPGCVLYTGNGLSGGCPEAKSGGRYADYAGVAIECQGYPDAVNHPEFPTVLLQEGELYCQKIVFCLRAE